MGGGQDLLGTMKDYILTPATVVDLKRIPNLNKITADSKGLRLGALVTITEVEEHPDIRAHYPDARRSRALHRHYPNPQCRNHRREPLPASPLLVLP